MSAQKPAARLSRRAFLRLALLTGIGASVVALNKITAPVGPVTYMRWLGSGKMQEWFGERAWVALAECPTYEEDILGRLRLLWQQAEIPDVRGKRILVKPNLVDTLDNHPATTAPQVVAALLDVLVEQGAAQVTVGDGPAFRRDAWPVAAATGLLDVLNARGVPFVDLNYADPQPVRLNDSWIRSERTAGTNLLWLPRPVLEADLIFSVPKLKCHHWANLSLSLKNLLGLVPGSRYGWPKNIIHVNSITASVLGVYRLLPPVVALVDGIIGMEGDGPLFGTPVQHGLLALGRDPLAVDVTCAELMGFARSEVEHLAIAAWAGLGQANPERIERRLVGSARLENLRRSYQRPPKM